MKECWSEGELRAYIDRELPTEDLRRIEVHLEGCPDCERVRTELARRSVRVAELMSALLSPETVSWKGPVPRRAGTVYRWVGVAAALAAGVGILAFTLSNRPTPKAPSPVAHVTSPTRTPVVAPVEAMLPTETVKPAFVRPARAARRHRPAPARRDGGFILLSDEPIDTGVVLRVALGPAEIPADVIYGSDGHARAIRLVNYKPNE